MPDTLLLLAFALTLILNAALILVAIRAMREAPSDVAGDDRMRDHREAEVAVESQRASDDAAPFGHAEPPPASQPWLPASLPTVPVVPRRNVTPARSTARPEPATTGPAADDTSGHRSEPATDDAELRATPAPEPAAADVPKRRRRRA